ncbi:MAG: hypothetical protein H8E30_09935 [Alphaproteobacteria bacterium]|nr:hypothetical protein [Alphaproteobacteria bacterium]
MADPWRTGTQTLSAMGPRYNRGAANDESKALECPTASVHCERLYKMSNVIRHHKFVLDQDDGTLTRLEGLVENLHGAIQCLLRSAPLFPPSEQIKLQFTCNHAIAEIEEMKFLGCFTRDRLNDLFWQLQDALMILQRKQHNLKIHS